MTTRWAARIWRVLLAVTLFELFALPSAAIAGPVQSGLFNAGVVIKIENKTGKPATDFHMQIFHRKADIADFGLDVFTNVASNEVPGPGVLTFTDIDWTGGNVPENGGIRIGVRLKSKKNEVRVLKAYWTGPDIDEMTPNRNVMIPTFKVEGDPIYTISNEMDEAFGIRGLQFLIDAPEVSFAGLSPFTLGGFGNPIADFILLPGESMAFNIPELTPGNYLYAQGRVFDASFAIEQTQFIHEHQSPVPEPSTLALVGAGYLTLLGLALQRRKNAKEC